MKPSIKPKVVTQTQVHPLLIREIRPIENWGEWVSRWNEAKGYEELIGLLHCGFDVRMGGYKNPGEYTYIDRMLFYFNVAEKWTSERIATPGIFWQDEPKYNYWVKDHQEEKTRPYLRGEIAKKAFSVLVSQKFKPIVQADTENQRRVRTIELSNIWGNNLLFNAFITFFRVEENRIINLSPRSNFENFGPSEKVAWGFIKCLIKYLIADTEAPNEPFDRKKDGEKYKQDLAEFNARLMKGKLWAFEVLEAMSETSGFLTEMGYRKLEDEDRELLTQIAMRRTIKHNGMHEGKDRPVLSLEEACYSGSSSANLLLAVERRRCVEAKLNKVRKAEQAFKEAQKDLAKLTT